MNKRTAFDFLQRYNKSANLEEFLNEYLSNKEKIWEETTEEKWDWRT